MQRHLQLAAWLRSKGLPRSDLPKDEPGWLALAHAAGQEGVSGLLLDHVSWNGLSPPDSFLRYLRTGAMSAAIQLPPMMTELERLVAVLDHARIPVMLLKGAALNLTIYDRPDLRPMSDLDLLVHPTRAGEAIGVLTRNGCRRGYDLIRDDFFPRYHYEVELVTQREPIVRIDLHARPFRPLRFAATMSDDALWQGPTSIRVGNAEAFLPRPEFMLLHLAAHAAFHDGERLAWLYDIKRWTERYGSEMDWELFLRAAEQWRLSCAVADGLDRASKLLGPVLPAGVMEQLRNHTASWRDRWTLRQAPRDAASPVSHVLCDLICVPDWRLRMGLLRAHVFPSAGHLASKYPFRHPGWIACAQGLRVLRALKSVVKWPVTCLGRALKAARRAGLPSVTAAAGHDPRPIII